jgi:hypothetical protein
MLTSPARTAVATAQRVDTECLQTEVTNADAISTAPWMERCRTPWNTVTIEPLVSIKSTVS